jgi:predicted negative regulator of RcsB-dependent stress response
MSGSYDFEEQERIAELKAWWEDNRWFVVGAVAAGVLAFAGYRGWNFWTTQQAENAGAMFAPVEAGVKAKDAAKVAEAGKALMDKYPGSFYASEAALIIAKDAFDAGSLDEARKQLEWVVAHGVDAHRGIARLRLASVLMEQKKFSEALQAIEGNTDEAFTALSADLRGDIMLAQGRVDEARAAYKLAMEKAAPRNPVRSIAETKLNALGGSQ